MINTKKCIEEIIKTFPEQNDDFKNAKNWKRLSKTGSMYQKRKFQNKKTNDIVIVESVDEDDEFNSINILNVNQTFFEFCRNLIETDPNEEISSVYSFVPCLPFVSLPKIKGEDVDFENNELIAINENGVTIAAGGDWQEPITFTATFSNGELHCNNDAYESFQEGIEDEEFLNILYGNNIPDIIKENWGIND